MYTRTEAEEAGLGNEDWVNVGWTNDLERVATHEHAYEVTYAAEAVGPFGEQTLTVNNRRIGLIDLTVEKEWVDGSAAPDDRPAAELVLRVDDSEARFFVEGGNAYAQLAGGNKIPLYDRDGAPLDSARVEDGGTALVVPVSPDSDASTYGFFGLPKYKGIASDGEVVHYTVEERFVDQRGQGDYVISSTAGDYLIGERHFHDEQTYRIANRRAGTTEVTFYKEWNDVYVNEALQRPDIALTLYQVSAETNEKPQPVEGYVHYLWQAASDEEEPVFGTSGSTTLAASQYLQSCTIDGLPKYDVLGDEITYYAVEEFMNDGTSLGYGDVTFSADRMTDPADPADPQLVEVASGNAADIDNSAGTAYAVRSGGTFVNSLTGTIVANGTKLWSNLPGSVQSADIPEITVFLQRKLATDDEWPDLYVRQDATGAWVPAGNADGSVGAVAWTSRMEQASDDSNRYTYSIASPGDNTNGSSGETLPAFDEDGNLYQYRAREVMVGLLDTPGYLQTNDVANVNFAQDTYVDGTGQVYDIRHGQTGSFYINNVYDATKGSLTVKKLFGGRDVGDAYPDVEFVLYRQYEGERGLSSPERVAAGAITAEELKQAEADGTDATYTFEGLELYAPNGAYWRYYVVEASIDGYATQVGLGDLALGAAEFGDGAVDDEGVASPPAVKDDGTSMVVAATSGDDGAPVYDTAVDVTFANTYEADALKLTGTKTWTDYGNAFGMRPDDIRLTLSRTSASGQEEASVPLQSDDPDAGNYLEWTQKGAYDASWTYAISNLEQWASDGSAWTYTIVETLPDGTTHYRTHVGTAEASGEATETEGAYEGAFGNLDNYLKGSVTVSKAWEDADDAWGLRPKSIEVQLQARYKALNATEDGYSAWMSAADAFAQLLNEVPSGFPSVEQTLGPGNAGGAWSYTWSSVPVRVKGDNGAIYTVEYRVVETKVGGEEATFDPANDVGASIVYDTTASYNGQQQTTWDDNETSASLAASSSTRITNTLDATELTVRKTWDDNDNEWGLRDIVYDQYRNERWSVTYKLQRSSDHGATWDWVTDGEGQVVTASITGSMDAQDATFGSNTATFANLPAQDGDGNAYRYRAVEVVPGGYDVENPLVGAPLEEGDALVAGDSGQAVASDGAHQTYVNSLYTIGLSGTKAWEDYGTGFAPAFDQDGDGVIDRAPDMKLYRTTGDPADQDAQWEEARTADGSMPQPAWSKGTDGTWTWTYSGLPRADGSGNAYTYRASETPGSIPGFYPAYAGGSTEVGADGDQTGDGITNTATRFALDKVNDWDVDPDAEGVQGEQLDGIELAVTSRDGQTTYAVWQRDAQGQVTTWTNPSGVATGEVWPNGTGNGQADTAKLTRMTGAAATYVVGLAAGDYLVRETGVVPQDHVRAEDVPFALAADGTVSSDVDGAVSQDGGVACVTAVDPVFRGYFTFAKALADDATSPVQGATFDLYRVGTAAGGGDELMAQGLTSGADGSFASADSDIALVGQTDGRRAALSDGLQAGEYYLMEVRTSDEAHLPSGDAAKFAFTLDAVANHGKAHAVTVQDNAAAEPGSQPAPVLLNDPFKATVTLFKHDAESGEGISEVEFRLTYTPADGGAPATTTPRTNAEGMLVLELSGKGSYELTETASEGYVVDTGFKATFTLDDEDHDGEFDLADADDRAAIEAVVEGDGMQQGTGLANTRLTGSASFKKESSADGAALDGAAFALQRQRADATWEDVATGLATGKAYVLDAAGGAAEDDSVMPEAGVLRISGLPWGTYRFVETVPSGGFAGQIGNDPVTSDAFVVARDTVEAEAVLQDVENRPTQLVLRKTNEDGSAALPDVRFTVTPTGASTFADGTTEAKELTTGADGTASLEGQLCVGATYDIAETAAPAGYELAGESLRVTVQADGSLAAADGVSAPWSLDGSAATVSLADEPIRAFVKKVNANDETQALSGVTFDVVGAFADGAASKSVETGADGTVLIEGLVAGNRYQVTETGVPAGYTRIAGTFAFDVRADGTLAPVGDMVGYRVDADGVTVVAADVPTRIVVEKVAEDGTLLPGARFTVTPTGASTFADGTTEAKELTTGADGTASLEGQLCVGATYDIAETAAPAGYELIAGTLSHQGRRRRRHRGNGRGAERLRERRCQHVHRAGREHAGGRGLAEGEHRRLRNAACRRRVRGDGRICRRQHRAVPDHGRRRPRQLRGIAGGGRDVHHCRGACGGRTRNSGGPLQLRDGGRRQHDGGCRQRGGRRRTAGISDCG